MFHLGSGCHLGFALLAGSAGWLLGGLPVPETPKPVTVELAAPPMEGNISIGVFSKSGQCVRVLYKNATPSSIPSALNGFLITWDGRTQGSVAADGEYEIRGVTVGNVKVKGEAYHFNDWIDADHPAEIPRKTLRIELLSESLRAWQQFASGTRVVSYDLKGHRLPASNNSEASLDLPELLQATRRSTSISSPDKKTIYSGAAETPAKIDLPELGAIIALAIGREDAFWVITSDEASGSRQLRQYSLNGEFLRELNPDAGEIIEQVAAAENDEEITLVSRIGDSERVRLLTQTSSSDNVSLWKTILQKDIQPCDEFGLDAGNKIIAKGDLPAGNSIAISLIENELTPGKKNAISFTAASLEDGLWLTTKGGLPIVQISPDLTSQRMALIRDQQPASLRFYANIGGAVAEFSISGLANMMQFTSEKIQWPPGPRETADEKDVPNNEPAPTPE